MDLRTSCAEVFMYAVVTKARQLNLPIDLQLHLFDTSVLPILLYGCEVWGYENIRVLDKFILDFVKYFLVLTNQLQLIWF